MYTLNIYQKIGYDFIRKMEEKCVWKKFVTKNQEKNTQKWKIIWNCSRSRSFQNMEVNSRKKTMVSWKQDLRPARMEKWTTISAVILF